MTEDPAYSVVIPVYNTDSSLSILVTRIEEVFNNIVEDSFEIVFVDDCSPKVTTWLALLKLSTKYDFVHSHKLAKNFGQGGALLCGMKKARGSWIITMDDDLQHHPEDIPLLIDQKEHDVVIGRFPKKRCGWFKKVSSSFKSYLDNKLLVLPKGLVSSPFKLIKKRVIQNILTIRTPRPFIIALILLVTSDLVNVYVSHNERKFGKSNYSLMRSMSLLSNMIFNNSSFLLRTMSVLGFFISGMSFLFGIILILKKVIYQQIVPGWTSLIVVNLILSGVTIFCIGVLGEYISRLIETSSNKPNFIIQASTDEKFSPRPIHKIT